MENGHKATLTDSWLELTNLYVSITNELEQALQERHGLSLKEYYLLYFLHETPEKRLRLQQLESMVGLSQSAMSRLVSRFEAKGCGALERYTCEADRRSIFTSLTAIGQAKVEQAHATFSTVLSEALPNERTSEIIQQLVRLRLEK
ncbi:MarR family winged helix-turn-helix transcriptional regulator [Paenibacillus sp. L3-i20]|uniref:MarR family winged helix-turn-helix transcriptional regulator n=1 Tax=Paenibacillus sp. L3-i20 TaxID=2905833 RepID=UPI001EE0B26D|nr:MarR family transcriptional regulator [Paenibacillus sp. L3-i20]GKU76455.1 MarR family transcriptional regulator [Paenibacillus sp. L3-i20]